MPHVFPDSSGGQEFPPAMKFPAAMSKLDGMEEMGRRDLVLEPADQAQPEEGDVISGLLPGKVAKHEIQHLDWHVVGVLGEGSHREERLLRKINSPSRYLVLKGRKGGIS